MLRTWLLRSARRPTRRAWVRPWFEALEDRRVPALLFSAAVNYPAGSGAAPGTAGVALGDLNGDKIQDMVVADPGSGDVTVYLGKGDGTFKAGVTYAAGTAPTAVAIGNFDGKVDIVVANNTATGTVSLLPGNGNGTFNAPAGALSGGSNAVALVTGDFDHDTNLDVAVVNQGSNNIGVLLGTGSGGFQKAATYATDTTPVAIAVGNFDGSGGLDDLAVADNGNKDVSVFVNLGKGTFGAGATYMVGTNPTGIAAGDLNGDAAYDLVVTNGKDDDISVLLNKNDGLGTMNAQTTFATVKAPSAVALGTFDADANLDVVVASASTNAVGVKIGDGKGAFGATTTYSTGQSPVAVAALDLDKNGRTDIATADSLGGTATVFLNTGTGAFQVAPTFPTDAAPIGVAMGDLNNDGISDAVTADSGGGDVSVLISKGDGTFQPQALFGTNGTGPGAVAVGKIDAGANLDVAAANAGSGTVSVLLGNGKGSLGLPTTYAAGTNPVAIALGDFDGKNGTDIVVANDAGLTNDVVTVLLADGKGGFTTPGATYAVGKDAVAVAVGDFDGKNGLDLAVVDKSDNNVAILLNKGDGTFAAAVTYAVGNAPTAVAVGDFDGKNGPDLVVTNSKDNTVSVLLNKGDGTFGAATTFAVGSSPMAVAVGDFNGTGNQGDGKLDIVTANANSYDASVLTGNGTGTFNAATDFVTGAGATGVGVADVTNDGAPDVVVADKLANNAALLVSNAELPIFQVTAPSTATAGKAFDVTVTAVFKSDGSTDTFYRGTAQFTSSDTTASFATNPYTFTAADAGVHTFTNGATLNKSGSQTITDTDTVQPAVTGFATVNVGASSSGLHYVFAAPGTATAGSPFTITVTVEDGSNNVVTSYTGTVDFTSTDGKASLPLDYQFTSGDMGVHTFTNETTLFTAGKQDVVGTDTTDSKITGKATITVNPAGTDHLDVTAPATVTAGSPFDVTVTAVDKYDNTTAGYTGSIAFATSDPQGTVPGGVYTFVGSDNGVHTFTGGVTLDTAGKQTVSATDQGTPSITGGALVTVKAAAANHLVVTAPSNATAGTPFTVTVTAADKFGNTDTGYLGTIGFTSSDTGASLPGNYPFVAGDAGVHTFTDGVTLVKAGSQTVTATDQADSTVTGGTAVQVAAATAFRFGFTAPAVVQANLPFDATVTVFDQFNNVATGYTGTAHFTSTDPAATLPADYTFTGKDAGVHTLPFTLATGVSQTITARDTFNNTVTGQATLPVKVVYLVSGADAGGGPEVKVIDPTTLNVSDDFYAYDSHFQGGVRVALGDINDDGFPDIITAPGVTGGPDIRVYSGKTGALTAEFMAYDTGFTGGVFVAAGDVNNDGFADVITGADAGGGPHVRVFDGKALSQGNVIVLQSFYAYDTAFTGGVRVASADVDGDGYADIITGAGPGGGPHVRVFSGRTGLAFQSFYAYDAGYTGGVYVAAGDTNGDGKADILTGGGLDGGPVKTLLFDGATGKVLQGFFPYTASFTGGTRVALADVNNDGRADILTGAGPGGGPHFQAFDATSLATLDSFYAYASEFQGGIFVGGH